MTGRARLAITLTLAGLAIAAAVAGATVALFAWLGPDPTPRSVTRLEQVGDRVALVRIVTEPGGTAGPGMGWVLAAIALAAVPVAIAAWWWSGRLLAPAHSLQSHLRVLEDSDAAQQQARHEAIHELRTPLAVAGTNLELARAEPSLAADAAGRIDAARRAIERMGRTVDGLANLEVAAVATSGDAIDLGAEGGALAASHAAAAHLAGVRVVTQGTDRVLVPAARSALHTAADNLLTNALRVAPTGSAVRVAWGRVGDWGWLGVTDAGPGLADEDHPQVFEPYWRGRYERDHLDPSSPQEPRGLGLPIARQAIEAQGGRLTLMSRPGAGSTFVIWLPSSPDAEASAIVAHDGIHSRVDPLAPSTA